VELASTLLRASSALFIVVLAVIILTPGSFFRCLQLRSSVSRANFARMAWRSSGMTNEELVSNLHRNGVIESEEVRQAMLRVRSSCISLMDPRGF
jgi:cell division protein YceG involved in septum cleavage